LRIGFHFPWRNTVTRQLAHIFCTVANQSTECSRLSRDQACVSCTNHRPFPGKKDAALLPVEMQWFGVSDMRRIAFPNMKSLLCFNPPFRTLILILIIDLYPVGEQEEPKYERSRFVIDSITNDYKWQMSHPRSSSSASSAAPMSSMSGRPGRRRRSSSSRMRCSRLICAIRPGCSSLARLSRCRQ
jgi:hypothetical protein